MKEKEEMKLENVYGDIRASVIIPVYNAEGTLAECLDSVLNQTMEAFEAICIDDGSSDRSWEILCAYASQDPRVRVFRQENQGPGKTRNHGIELARGEYLFFVDADDLVKPTLLETVCDIGRKQDADVVLFDGDRFDAQTRKRIPTKHFLRKDLIPENVEVFSAQDFSDTIFQISVPTGWARAYRRALVSEEGLHFSEFPNSEDLFFTYSCLAAAGRVSYSTKKLYLYRVGQSTNVESGKAKAPLCIVEAYLDLAHWLQERALWEPCKKSFGIRFFESIIHSIKTIDSVAARQAICRRLLEEDVAQLRLLDQSDAFYHDHRAARQVRWLLRSHLREPVTRPKVSVIIPVYNVEKYLADCLESLLRQTMPEFEVLCVDDGSTDSSSEILRLYSRLDPRIKVLFGDHQGAAAARNQGIDLATGEYLFFMDSDDLAADTLLEKTYNAGVQANADVVAFDIYSLNMRDGKFHEERYVFRSFNAPTGKSVFSVVDAANHIFQISNPSPWSKLIRREHILEKQLRYQDLHNTNDAYFAHMAMALADRITLVNERLYIYRVGMVDNIQSKKDAHPECVVEAYLAIYDRLVKERIWTLCEKSWIAEFLAVICFTIKTIKTRTALKKLYHRLLCPDVAATGYLEHEEAYYPERYHYDLVKKFLASPIKYADADERDTKVLVRGQCAEPVVSVIIPVYNVEDYLAECLDSIRNQTLKQIEIICVDDGSSDDSLRICCQAAKEDPRITVLSQNNSGLSAARNSGIQASRGRYLYYIDSDDMLVPDALELLVETAEENDLDYILFGGKTFYENPELQDEHKSYANLYNYRSACVKPMPGVDLFVILNNSTEFCASACMQMAKRELILENRISFYEGIIHEDELYTLQVLLSSKRCMAIPERLYLRRMREGSIMTASASISRLLGHLVCYTESLRFLERMELTGPQYAAVYQRQNVFVWHIRKFYSALTGDERIWVHAFCTGYQRCIYNTLAGQFNSAKPAAGASASTAAQDRRLNDHDTALRYAQDELAQNRTRLNDHDTALGYAQEELAQNHLRLNDHDTALGYAQEELAQNHLRLNDHDAALGYLQADIADIRSRMAQQKPGRMLRRILTWLPRKLKALLR